MAAQEGDMMNFAQRLAGSATVAGMGQKDILAVSAAMASVGINAEAGGSAMSKILTKMNNAVKDGGEKLEGFAETSGLSAEEFSKTWEKDPYKALQLFEGGLNKQNKAGENVNATLKDLGITEIRERDTVLRLANGNQQLANARTNADKGFKEGIALNQEAETKYKTLGNQMKIFMNNVRDLGISIGGALAPLITFIMKGLTPMIQWLSKAPGPVRAVVGVLALLAAAIGPVIVGLGMLVASIGAIMGSTVVMGVLSAIAGAIGAISLPVVAAVAGIAALIAALAWLNTKIKPIDWGPIWSGLKSGLVNAWNATITWFKNAWASFTAWLPSNKGQLSASWNNIWSGTVSVVRNIFSRIIGAVKTGFFEIINFFKYIGGILKPVFTLIWSGLSAVARWYMNNVFVVVKAIFLKMAGWFRYIGGVLKGIFITMWGGIKNVTLPIVRAIVNTTRTIFGVLAGFFRTIWGGIKATFSWGAQACKVVVLIIFTAISKLIKFIFNGIKNFLTMIWRNIKVSIMFYANLIKRGVTVAWQILSKVTRTIFNALRSFLVAVWTVIKNRVVGQARLLWNIMRGIWNVLSKVSRAIFSNVRNFLVAIWTNLRNRVVAISRALWNIVRSIWNTLSKVSRSIFSNVRNFIVSVWTNLRNKVVSISRSLWNIMRGIWNTLSKVSKAIFSNVRNFLVSVWTNLKNRVVAITRSLWNIVRGVWNTLSKVTRNIFNSVRNFLVSIWTKIRDKVAAFARSLWSNVSRTWNNLSKGTRNIFNKVGNYLVDKWQGIKNSVTGTVSGLWSSVKKIFTNMKNGIQGLSGRIGDTITNMVKGIKKGLNSLIHGVNWVAKKLGIDQEIPDLHTGTGGVSHTSTGVGVGVSNGVVSSPGLATINDRGRGNGTGTSGRQELIQKADGRVFAPKGKDVTVPLGKGDRVINGRDTQRLQKSGVVPKFAKGLGSGIATEKMLKDFKKKKKKHDDKEHGAFDAIGEFGPGAGGVAEWIAGNAGSLAGKGAKKKKELEAGTKAAKKVAGDKIGELLDYVGKPGKLLDAVLGKFGVKFPKIKGQIPKDMMWDPMWKSLKNGTRTLFDGWLTEAEGAGDGGYVDLSKGINFGFGFPPGYPFNRPHNGLDINYKYGEKLYSTLAGPATGKSGYNGGFGNSMWIKSGPLQAIYGHMSKLAWTGTKQVKPGSYLGKSGGDPSRQGKNAGDSTGPHLHYEMRRNGKPFDPTKWLKSNNGGGGASGKWSGNIKKALKLAGLPTSGAYVKAWAKQIQTESGGNAKALGGTDGLADGRAKGLVQVKPGTFNAYKLPGHGNIWNGLDNLIAGIRYAKSRYGAKGMLSVIGKGHGYAKGTDAARAGLANVFEKGGEIMNLRGGEQIIPNDVSINALKQMMSSDLFARTQSAVYAGISQYADALRQQEAQSRAKELQARQQANASSNEIAELKSMVADMVYLMQAQLGVQENIAGTNQQIANKNTTLDGKKVTKEVSEQEAFNLLMRNYNGGITRH